ncbi:transposase [Longilinea arvoryzae]|uniref:Transposase n=1 Tax=Longilinea arvoryzae TaxID=360412 RepID=A0A0K8MXW2_9CHLR|nr:transposase [Longilinea arvoryzae]GAP16093.1 transposase [Longilinea arvoryzae]
MDNSANRQYPNRHSIRLKGYDYSQPGAYFVTICTHHNECLFGEVVNGDMVLNALGEQVRFTWFDLVNHVPNIELGPFGIMPNHVHGVIEIVDGSVVGAGSGPAMVRAGSEPARTEPARTPIPLSEIVRQFKTFSARRVNALRGLSGVPVWHRNYWEHIIRNEESYEKIAMYITHNPLQWEMDRFHR